jgi:ATP-dependent DNA ligase
MLQLMKSHGREGAIAKRSDSVYQPGQRTGFWSKYRVDFYAHLRTPKCPFVNLPEPAAGRWGQRFAAEKMETCVWVRPEVVAEIQFLEWTGADHLRHTKFAGLKDDKDPAKIVKET